MKVKTVNIMLFELFPGETASFLNKLDKAIKQTYDSLSPQEYPESYAALGSLINGNLRNYKNGFQFLNDLYGSDSQRSIDAGVAEVILLISKRLIQLENVDAMNLLASLYYRGRFGEADYVKARKFYLMAADCESPNGFQNLGYIFYYGLGTKVDYKKAYHFFMKAFMRGDGEAAYKLGDMYRYGFYVEKDFATARTMYFRSFDILNEIDGCMCMGDISKRVADVFYEGIGVEQNRLAALRYYQRAEAEYYNQIKNGDPWAEKYLDYCIGRQNEIRQHVIADLK